MISETSACKKYSIQKEDIEALGLKYITTPCPYFKNKMMKLFYEFQIKRNMHVIRAKHKGVRAGLKRWKDDEMWEKLKAKRDLVLNALMLYFKRRDKTITKE